MSKTKILYKCEVKSYFTEEMPDCYNCSDQSCMYIRGFAPEPDIKVKYVEVDDEGKTVRESEVEDF